MLKDINPTDESYIQIIQELSDERLIFYANDGMHGSENWITDGTTDGTYMISDDPTNDPEL
jgi:ELWxxDGT repeat protein